MSLYLSFLARENERETNFQLLYIYMEYSLYSKAKAERDGERERRNFDCYDKIIIYWISHILLEERQNVDCYDRLIMH